MSSLESSANSEAPISFAQAMHDHWSLFLTEGLLLSLLGCAAILVPPIAGLTATVFLGWLFFAAGVLGLISTFRTRGVPGFGWSLLSAFVALVAGVMLLWNPFQGLVTLTFVMVAYFIVDGILMIVLAIAHRRELSGKWEWMMLNGFVDLILAGIIIAGFPSTLVWALGLLVGIDLLFGGTTLVAMALAARKAQPSTT